jgi:hypothetical protein
VNRRREPPGRPWVLSPRLRRPRLQCEEVGMSLRVLRSHGWSLTALAQEFGMNWRTVKREVESEARRRYRGTRGSGPRSTPARMTPIPSGPFPMASDWRCPSSSQLHHQLIRTRTPAPGRSAQRGSLGPTWTRNPESTDEVGVQTQRQATNPTGTMELIETNVSAGGHLSGASLSHAAPPRHHLR